MKSVVKQGENFRLDPDYKPFFPLYHAVFCFCTVVTTTSATTAAPPTCAESGWTDWIDSDDPNSGGGDTEIITNLQNQGLIEMCAIEDITDVQCR